MLQYRGQVPVYDSDDIGVVQEQVDERLRYFSTHTGVIEEVVDNDKGLVKYSCLPLGADPEEPETFQYALPVSAKEKEKKPETGKEILISHAEQNPNKAVYRLLDDTEENEINAGGGKFSLKPNSFKWESGDEQSGIEIGDGKYRIKVGGVWFDPPLTLP